MIEYKNSNGKTVTAQQFSMLKEGKIYTYDDATGKLKKTENFSHFNRAGIKRTWYEYYLDSSENKNNIVQQYTNSMQSHSVLIYFNKQSIFGFEAWDCEFYNENGVLKSKKKIVTDEQGRIILRANFDLQTNEITHHPAYSPTKYYFGTSLDMANGLPNLELIFTYEFDTNTNQFVTSIKDINETTGQINTMNVAKFIELFGQAFWDAHPYYHSLTPFLPTSGSI